MTFKVQYEKRGDRVVAFIFSTAATPATYCGFLEFTVSEFDRWRDIQTAAGIPFERVGPRQ